MEASGVVRDLAGVFFNTEVAEDTEKGGGKEELGDVGELNGASMGNSSMEVDYCQVGNSTECSRFELRQNKWSGWKRIGGNSEFGETGWGE
jgi:hypothetical protein